MRISTNVLILRLIFLFLDKKRKPTREMVLRIKAGTDQLYIVSENKIKKNKKDIKKFFIYSPSYNMYSYET